MQIIILFIICILMIINEDKTIKRKTKCVYLQMSYISAKYCPIQPYLVPK